MSTYELVVLGSASMIPTRERNHNGYMLRWAGRNILFDPGEGTQRQCTLAGVSPSGVTDICITHFHGDHCLGLPGMIQRLSQDRITRTIPVAYPDAGQEYFDRLRTSSIFHDITQLAPRPLPEEPTTWDSGGLCFEARPLDHRVPTLGYRISEPDGVRFLPDKLAASGVGGPDVGRLQEAGAIEIDGRQVLLADVTEPKRGTAFAFIMDTRTCDAAVTLARGADMAVIESTYLETEGELADSYGHLTAASAARIAEEAGVGLLVLTHFSPRYEEPQAFVDEARAIHPHTILATDLERIPLPRPPGGAGAGLAGVDEPGASEHA